MLFQICTNGGLAGTLRLRSTRTSAHVPVNDPLLVRSP
jgi:hypothetical protein